MANKIRYFKFTNSFTESTIFMHLMNLEHGSDFVIIWLMLGNLANLESGFLTYSLNKNDYPYNRKQLENELSRYFTGSIVNQAIDTLVEVGLLIVLSNGTIKITGNIHLLGEETKDAKRYREKKSKFADKNDNLGEKRKNSAEKLRVETPRKNSVGNSEKTPVETPVLTPPNETYSNPLTKTEEVTTLDAKEDRNNIELLSKKEIINKEKSFDLSDLEKNDEKTLEQFNNLLRNYPKDKRGNMESIEIAQRLYFALDLSDSEYSVACKTLHHQRFSDDWLKEGGKWIPYFQKWIKECKWRAYAKKHSIVSDLPDEEELKMIEQEQEKQKLIDKVIDDTASAREKEIQDKINARLAEMSPEERAEYELDNEEECEDEILLKGMQNLCSKMM